jgi:hypothetical protein
LSVMLLHQAPFTGCPTRLHIEAPSLTDAPAMVNHY